KRVTISPSENVARGQELLVLDDTDLRFDVERRQLTLRHAALSASEGTMQQVGASQSTVAVEQAQLELHRSQLQLAASMVRAPASGRVIHVGVREGDMVSPGSAPAVIIAKDDQCWIEA